MILRFKYPSLLILFALLCLYSELAICQSKEWEKEVIYNESQVPYFELPDLLTTVEGKKINSVDEWLYVRRPQIMSMLATNIYGRVPIPESPIKTEYETLDVDKKFFDGRCTRKRIKAVFSNERGSIEMNIVVFVPNGIQRPVPVLLRMGFSSVTGKNIEMENIQSYGKLGNGTPLVDLIEKGFGLVCIKGGEIIGDEVSFRNSIHKLFYKGSQSLIKADEWGVLAGISWQYSRTMDYLETDDDVDHKKVAILGFSKLGKSTLWAGALDTRFAMVLSQNSGAAGAALWRRNFGENLKYITRFPRWLCGNAKKYVGSEHDLPVDQHMLLACIAPRPLYVVSGINDLWADNQGEYLSTHYATPVYELFGLKGQPTLERPKVNQPSDDRALAYHVRSGAHGYHQFDWDQYIKFMDYHFNKN
ncbi:MAG: hypothetical protein JXQ96_14140 [Cyclobacteriaceae bacterium]